MDKIKLNKKQARKSFKSKILNAMINENWSKTSLLLLDHFYVNLDPP